MGDVVQGPWHSGCLGRGRVQIGPKLSPGDSGDALDLENALRRNPPPLRDSLALDAKGDGQGAGSTSGLDSTLEGGSFHAMNVRLSYLPRQDLLPCLSERPAYNGGMKIGARIKATREAMGWSQDVLGQKLGITREAISQIEKKSDMSISRATAIAAAFSMTLPELLAGRAAEKNEPVAAAIDVTGRLVAVLERLEARLPSDVSPVKPRAPAA